MEKVVVVVVVTMREGSRLSGPRLDWANLSDASRWAASSLDTLKVRSDTRGEKKTRYVREERVMKGLEELLMACEVEGNDQG